MNLENNPNMDITVNELLKMPKFVLTKKHALQWTAGAWDILLQDLIIMALLAPVIGFMSCLGFGWWLAVPVGLQVLVMIAVFFVVSDLVELRSKLIWFDKV